MKFIIVLLAAIGGYVNAHQWTPTYPEMRPSYVQGLYTTKMHLFNGRKEINYYSIRVFDKEWDPVPFAASPSLLEASYLAHLSADVYIRRADLQKAYYICSKSKILSTVKDPSIIASRICSKIKK
jgi:hypothetical protein|tara:strand:+ start:1193 stop:1567 length:375 start_codon:yes stop_codon:yes gene_type:complete